MRVIFAELLDSFQPRQIPVDYHVRDANKAVDVVDCSRSLLSNLSNIAVDEVAAEVLLACI